MHMLRQSLADTTKLPCCHIEDWPTFPIRGFHPDSIRIFQSIPEMDMPGHSECFRIAMGFAMNTPQGMPALKTFSPNSAGIFPPPTARICTWDRTKCGSPTR